MAKFKVLFDEITYVTKEIEIEVPDSFSDSDVDKIAYDFDYHAKDISTLDELIEHVRNENEFDVIGTEECSVDTNVKYLDIRGEDE